MNRYGRMRGLIGVTAMAGLRLAGLAGGGAAGATLPKDPCALLKPPDIQSLAGNAKIGSEALTTQAPFEVTCVYIWGPDIGNWGRTALKVGVGDLSKFYPAGLSSDEIKERVLVMVRTGGPGASEVAGIGDGAVFTTNPKNHDATVTAFLMKAKAVLLTVNLHGANPLAEKDRLIALLKLAAAAL